LPHQIILEGQIVSDIKLRTKWVDGKLLVRALLSHPMDTGRRQDSATGKLIPAHFIQELRLLHNGQVVMDAQLSTAVSRDPYFSFKLAGVKAGDQLALAWKDNFGLEESAEIEVE
jgi:sulfur-oxidizing protein SoxZ